MKEIIRRHLLGCFVIISNIYLRMGFETSQMHAVLTFYKHVIPHDRPSIVGPKLSQWYVFRSCIVCMHQYCPLVLKGQK